MQQKSEQSEILGVLSGLIIILALIAGAGFFLGFGVDLFSLGWDAGSSLFND